MIGSFISSMCTLSHVTITLSFRNFTFISSNQMVHNYWIAWRSPQVLTRSCRPKQTFGSSESVFQSYWEVIWDFWIKMNKNRKEASVGMQRVSNSRSGKENLQFWRKRRKRISRKQCGIATASWPSRLPVKSNLWRMCGRVSLMR